MKCNYIKQNGMLYSEINTHIRMHACTHTHTHSYIYHKDLILLKVCDVNYSHKVKLHSTPTDCSLLNCLNQLLNQFSQAQNSTLTGLHIEKQSSHWKPLEALEFSGMKIIMNGLIGT